MTKYLAEVPDDIWKAFKIVCAVQGIKIKEGIDQAIAKYIEGIQTEQVKVNFKVVEDRKKNLLTFIYETELKTIIEGIIEAKKRNAPKQFQDNLKDRLKDIVKKHPTIPKELADEVLQVFKTL